MSTANNIRKMCGSCGNSISLGNSTIEKLAKLGLILLIGSISLGFLALPVYASWPDCNWKCTAKDIAVTRVWLGDDSGNELPSCNPGDTVAAHIWATINNMAAANRYAVWSVFDLYINGKLADGVATCVEDTIPGNTVRDYNIYPFITWTCGETVELVDLVISFATASGTTCSDTPTCAERQAHCCGPETVTVEAPAVLAVEVVAPSGQTADPGDSISYNFTVRNTGNILDTYDLVAQSQHGWSLSCPSSITVSAGESKTVKVTLSVPSDAIAGTTDELTLTATSQTDPGIKDSDTTITTVGAVPALEVKAPAGQSATPGDVITYRFVVRNNGNATDTYSLSARSQHGWSLSCPSSITVSAGESKTVKVTLSVPTDASAGITDELKLTATSQTDPGVKDSDITTTTVTAPVMTINKTDNVSSANVGERLVYTITYRNSGSGKALAQITDLLPEGVTYDPDDPASPPPDEIQSQKLIWKDSISPVAANSGSLIITIPVKVNLDVEDQTTLTNQAILDYQDLNGNPQPQETAEDETLIKAPQLILTKDVNKSEAERGDILVYYLTIKNNGTGTAYGVKIIDTLPRGLSYLKGSSALNGTPIDDPTGRNPYTWSIPDISGNSRTIINYKVIISPNAPHKKIQNQAELTSSNAPRIRAVSFVKIVKGEGPLEQKGTVQGVVFEDVNANGRQDSGEPGLANVEIRLDGPRMAKTDEAGRYKFEEVERGRHVAALDPRTLPEGYVLIGSDSKFVGNLAPGQTRRVNFAVKSLPGKIVGMVFLDADRDGKRDPGTAGISGISIVLNDTLTIDTDENGNFQFDNLFRGEYEVQLDTKKLGKNYRLTTDKILEIPLSPGETISVDFGLQPRPYLTIKVR